MTGPNLPSPKYWLKLPVDLLASGLRKAWLALTGRWRECPARKGKRCCYAKGGMCGRGPGEECPTEKETKL